jgi:mRNA interferase YafQ
MYAVETTSQFKRDVKKAIKSNKNMLLLKGAILQLESTGTVPANLKPHKLKGDLSNYWECHLQPDWLLIWKIDKAANVIELIRLGSHSQLF